MTALDDFLVAHFHYAESYFLWVGTCHQLRDFSGPPEQRSRLVDRTLELATYVSDNIDEAESLMNDAVRVLHASGDAGRDLLDGMSLAANAMREHRARADSYAKAVLRLRSGDPNPRPRRPQVANPFLFPQEERAEDVLDEISETVPVADGSGDAPGFDGESAGPEEAGEEASQEDGADVPEGPAGDGEVPEGPDDLGDGDDADWDGVEPSGEAPDGDWPDEQEDLGDGDDAPCGGDAGDDEPECGPDGDGAWDIGEGYEVPVGTDTEPLSEHRSLGPGEEPPSDGTRNPLAEESDRIARELREGRGWTSERSSRS